MNRHDNNNSYCRVNSDFHPIHENLLIVRKGEILSIRKNTNRHWSGWKFCKNTSGEAGWIPERYLKIDGELAKVLRDYAYSELHVIKGDELFIEKEISGWLWCVNNNGNRGWIPVNNVDRI